MIKSENDKRDEDLNISNVTPKDAT